MSNVNNNLCTYTDAVGVSNSNYYAHFQSCTYPGMKEGVPDVVSHDQTFRGRERLVTIASILWTTPECWRDRKLIENLQLLS